MTPTETTTYTITAAGANSAQLSCTVTVKVSNNGSAPRVITFAAGPSTIYPGDPTTISWLVDNADKVSISEIGTVGLSGSQRVTAISQDKTYTITATNQYGSTTASLLVAVRQPTLSNCQASPSTIAKPGDPTQLMWSVNYADRIEISPYSGAPPSLNVPLTVRPTTTTTYSLTAIGPDGAKPATCTITVTVPTAP